jgi:hypothetical protein
VVALLGKQRARFDGRIEDQLQVLADKAGVKLDQKLLEDLLRWGLGLEIKEEDLLGPYIAKKEPVYGSDQKAGKKVDKTGELHTQLKVPRQENAEDCAAEPMSNGTVTNDEDPTAW